MDRLESFARLGNEIRIHEFGGPSADLMRVNIRRALDTQLFRCGLQSEVVAPAARRTLAQLVDSWRQQVRARIDPILNPPADKDEAA